jgi:hypothetical protein
VPEDKSPAGGGRRAGSGTLLRQAARLGQRGFSALVKAWEICDV